MEKKIKVYQIIDNISGRPVTIVLNKKQVQAYINKFVMTQNMEHFLMWCSLRELNPEDESSWMKYVVACKPEMNFTIRVGKVPLSALIASFRTACGCLPLGLPWELKAETEAYKEKLPQEIRDLMAEANSSNMSPSEIEKRLQEISQELENRDAK